MSTLSEAKLVSMRERDKKHKSSLVLLLSLLHMLNGLPPALKLGMKKMLTCSMTEEYFRAKCVETHEK